MKYAAFLAVHRIPSPVSTSSKSSSPHFLFYRPLALWWRRRRVSSCLGGGVWQVFLARRGVPLLARERLVAQSTACRSLIGLRLGQAVFFGTANVSRSASQAVAHAVLKAARKTCRTWDASSTCAFSFFARCFQMPLGGSLALPHGSVGFLTGGSLACPHGSVGFLAALPIRFAPFACRLQGLCWKVSFRYSQERCLLCLVNHRPPKAICVL